MVNAGTVGLDERCLTVILCDNDQWNEHIFAPILILVAFVRSARSAPVCAPVPATTVLSLLLFECSMNSSLPTLALISSFLVSFPISQDDVVISGLRI